VTERTRNEHTLNSSCFFSRILGTVIFHACCLLLLSPSGTPAAQAQTLQEKSLDRWPDPVVSDCGLFPRLLGKPIADIRVVAWKDGTLLPIPFQIDERNQKGDRIYLYGEKANPGESNGRMDAGDEMVFMARDTGDLVSPEALPGGVDAWQEVEILDPLTQEKGWCYVLCVNHPAAFPLSTKDYIRYDPSCRPKDAPPGECVVSEYVEDRFYPMPPYYQTKNFSNNGFSHRYMANPPHAGGDETNYVDRMKTRFEVALFFGSVKLNLDENSMTFYELAYTDGPVRLVRQIQLIMTLPMGIKAPGFAVDLLWYDTIVDVPMVVNFPINPGLVLTYIQITQGEDQSPGAMGMRVYNSNNPEGVVVDGRMSPMEQKWANEKDFWRLLTGPQGSNLRRSFWDPHWEEQMVMLEVNYVDDLRRKDPPEEVEGYLGCILQTNKVKSIHPGKYSSYLEWYWPPSFLFHGPDRTYRPGDEKQYLNMADHPLRLTVGRKTVDNSYFGPMPEIGEAFQPDAQSEQGL
jgi:hypothetical protein